MDFIQILALSFRASVVNNTASTTGSLLLVPGLKYQAYYHTHARAKELHSTQKNKSLQSGSHMFLNVPDELRPVPSLLYEVVGVV